MRLEQEKLKQELQRAAGHTLHYHRSNPENTTLKSFVNSFDPNTNVCFVSQSTLLNPILVLQELSNSLKKEKNSFENIPVLLRSIYGQMRSLNELALTKKMIITQNCRNTFENSLENLVNESEIVLDIYRSCSAYSPQCEHFVETLLDEAYKLKTNIQDKDYRGDSLLVKSLLKEYRRTNFYKKKVRFSDKVEKVLADDLFLFGIASYESKKNFSGERKYLVCGNRALLAGGPCFVNQRILSSPEILCPEPKEGYGKKFSHHFGRYNQPIGRYIS